MTNSKWEELTRAESAQRTIDTVTEHAIRYKELFHSMQDKYSESQDEVVARGRTIRHQRQIIADLERKLGIDQEL